MTKSVRHKGAIEAIGAATSLVDSPSAFMDVNGVYARFGAKGPTAAGVQLMVNNAGTPLVGLIVSSAGALSTAGGITSGSGLALLAGQIFFPSGQIPSADPNCLDDYEEGLFTPIVTFGGGNTGITYAQQTGSYTKIGNRVFFSLDVVLSSKGSSVGGVAVGGLPFAADGSFYKACSVYTESLTGTSGGIMALVVPVTTAITVYQSGVGGTTQLTNTNCTVSSSAFLIVGHYTV